MYGQGEYSGWQILSFWVMWGLLLVPGYGAAFGAWLAIPVVSGSNEGVDGALTVILVLALLGIAAIAAYTFWHFRQHSRGFFHIMSWFGVGLVIIPLLTVAGIWLSFSQLLV